MKKLGTVRNPLHHSHPLLLVDAKSVFGGWDEHEDVIGGMRELVLDGVRAFLAGRSDHGPATVFDDGGKLVIVNPEDPAVTSAEAMAAAPRSKSKVLGKLEVPCGRLSVAIAYYPIHRKVKGSSEHTPESKLELDIGAGVFEVSGDSNKTGSRVFLRRTKGAVKAIKVAKAASTSKKAAAPKTNPKIASLMALLGGDGEKAKTRLRAAYADAANAKQAGLSPAEVKTALSANGDPPLSTFMKLIALRGREETTTLEPLSAAATAMKNAKVDAAIALLGGDFGGVKAALRKHYTKRVHVQHAGLEASSVKRSLADDGDPLLYELVKLIAFRGEEEVERWKELTS